MTAQITRHMDRETLRQYLQEPQPCRYCGHVPTVYKAYWNVEHTLWNWRVACQNPECKMKPFFDAYSWDDREMAVAKWNDECGA